MSRKYIKGKDGKFKGSLPSSSNVPKILKALPKLPTLAESPTAGLGKSSPRVSTTVVNSEFYISSRDYSFTVPADVARKLESGDYMYFTDEHILFTDYYGDNNASHYPYSGKREDALIDLEGPNTSAIAEEIENANSFSDLTHVSKDVFTLGGCASLAEAMHNQLPGSTLGVIVGIAQDNPNDATVAHVYVQKDGKIFDGYGVTNLEDYSFSQAADLDESYFDVLIYDTDSTSVSKMINHGCFGYEFTENSKDAINKVAQLVIQDK